MKSKLATQQQIMMAKMGIGRITRNGVYQSPKDIERYARKKKSDAEGARTIRNTRAKVKRDINKILDSMNWDTTVTRGKSVEYNAEYYNKILQNIGDEYSNRQLKTLRTVVNAYENLSQTNISKAEKGTKQYRKQVARNISIANELHDVVKGSDIESLDTKKKFYAAHKKQIDKAIAKWTYGASSEQGIWVGTDMLKEVGGAENVKRLLKQYVKEHRREMIEDKAVDNFGRSKGFEPLGPENYQELQDYIEYEYEKYQNEYEETPDEEISDEEMYDYFLWEFRKVFGNDWGYEDLILQDIDNYIKYRYEYI